MYQLEPATLADGGKGSLKWEEVMVIFFYNNQLCLITTV